MSVKKEGEAESNVLFSGRERTTSTQIKVYTLTPCNSHSPSENKWEGGTYISTNELPSASRQ